MKQIDMSSKAIDWRLRMASELTKLCLSLSDAGRKAGLHNRTNNGIEKIQNQNPKKENDE